MTSADSSTPKERRTLARTRLRVPIRFRTEELEAGWHSAVAHDLSAAGMRVSTDSRVDVSTRVVVMFNVPGERMPSQFAGIVTRTELEEANNRYQLGIAFAELGAADRDRLTAALQKTDVIRLLKMAAQAGGSDVHLSANHPPLIRLAGQISPLTTEPIEGPDLKHMIYTLMDDRQRQAFERDLELNFSLSIEPTVRYRVNVHTQRGNVEAAFRRIEPAVRSVEDLNLPEAVERLADLTHGLVLITGPTGAGKTTTVAAMVNHINVARAAVIITLESPIEYVYTYKQSVIKQREIGVDTHSFPIALKEAMRQDPDVIVVGEVRDEETMKTALDAAETGHLVLATFPAADCTDSILRVVHFFPKDRQQEIQLRLANCLRAILSQCLLPRADTRGVIPATELLVQTPAVANLIRSAAIEQIPSVIQTSMKQGMYSFESSLERLYRMQWISLETVRLHSPTLAEKLQRP
ncbi:MAG: PilT/PilU family type 4a pilus ATPase [Candidatus Omnitrophica bacterium]|nr:PilT/PilU family type 4a pilus ATPase [Candidatus Omnitrophota bacterium]